MARIGGDEFVALTIESSHAGPQTFTARLQDHLGAHNASEKHPFRLSLSMGTSWYDPADPTFLSELLDQAYRAMYQQKD